VFDLEITLQLSGVSVSIIVVFPDAILELQLSGVSVSIIVVFPDVILELQLSGVSASIIVVLSDAILELGVSASIISVLSDDSVTPTALLAFSGTVLMSIDDSEILLILTSSDTILVSLEISGSD
jgi:hypothetical protein